MNKKVLKKVQEILDDLSGLEHKTSFLDEDDRVSYLGCGCHSYCYDLKNGYVLKISKNEHAFDFPMIPLEYAELSVHLEPVIEVFQLQDDFIGIQRKADIAGLENFWERKEEFEDLNANFLWADIRSPQWSNGTRLETIGKNVGLFGDQMKFFDY